MYSTTPKSPPQKEEGILSSQPKPLVLQLILYFLEFLS